MVGAALDKRRHSELSGPNAGLAVLDGKAPPTWLEGSYLWAAVLADLNRRVGNADTALHYEQNAVTAAPSDAVRTMLRRRLHAP